MAGETERHRARASAVIVRRSIDEERAKQRRRSRLRTLITLALIAFMVWGANVTLVGNPVRASLAGDAHAAGIGLVGHLGWYVDPTTIVLDLRQLAGADTMELFPAALAAGGQLFAPDLVRRVVFARSGEPVYELSGADFRRLGAQLAARRNPVLVLRDLPALLRQPDGTTAPVADAADASRHWAGAP
jgi:hypothetical protein